MAVTSENVLTPPAVDGAGTGHAHFGRLLLAEWTKLRSVRSTYWSFVALIVAFAFFCWLIPFVTVHSFSNATGTQQANFLSDPVATILGGGQFLGQLAVAVLGVMVTAGEYSTGMIRSTLLASPHRVRMLAAKSLVFTLVVLAIGEAVSFIGFFIGQATVRSLVSVDLSGTNLREVFGSGLYLAMLGLFSLVLGSLIRHVAGAITGVVALLLVIGNVIALIPGTIGKYLYTYEPTNAGAAVFGRHLSSSFLITPWEGYGVFAAWTAALWTLAAWLLVRRDA
jgi:ABC-2 type transport system permease protein